MSDPPIVFEEWKTADGELIAVARLNTPRNLNSLSMDMISLLKPQLSRWAEDPKVQAVWLEAEGDKAFCAGGGRPRTVVALPFHGPAARRVAAAGAARTGTAAGAPARRAQHTAVPRDGRRRPLRPRRRVQRWTLVLRELGADGARGDARRASGRRPTQHPTSGRWRPPGRGSQRRRIPGSYRQTRLRRKE